MSKSHALNNRNKRSVRPDFAAQEILSGRTLYFAQDDTRSWGLNVYSLRTISSSPDYMIVKSRNISPVRLGPVTIFKSKDSESVLFINRLEDNTWGYFNLSVVHASPLPLRKKSMINRQAAFLRFLVGQVPDGLPALAP